MSKIFAFHLLNDYSGSPKVLRQLIKGWLASGKEVHLTTSLHKDGFLSNIKGLNYHSNSYKFYSFIPLRVLSLWLNQLLLILKMFKEVGTNDIIYINTVLPFGAAFLGKMKGCKIIYHVHETSVKPAIFKNFLFGMVRWTAFKVVYVSKYLATQESMPNQTKILYNAIGDDFVAKALKQKKDQTPKNNILMVCSLKRYKGIDEFVTLARMCPKYNFRMVLNAPQNDVDNYFGKDIPTNLTLYPTQNDVHPFYQWASVVLNLSRIDQWVETFGLTVIEAGAYGIPVIVPPVGGIAEIIADGVQGYKISSYSLEEIKLKLNTMLSDPAIYQFLSKNAFDNTLRFSESEFVSESLEIVNLGNSKY